MKDFAEARQKLRNLRFPVTNNPVTEPPRNDWHVPWLSVPSPLGDIQIDAVDEDYIEESGMNRDFVEGDNWLHDQRQTDHPKYVPDHHIFLAAGLFKIGMPKVIKTLAHELTEVILEAKGQTYEQAHPKANEIETEVGKAVKA